MTDRTTIETYSSRARQYQALEISDMQVQSLAGFLDGLPPGAALLDLGCGPGHHAAEMQAAGFQVTALDATPAFVEAARARGVAARLGSFDDLTETDAYAGIWASFSLLHAPRADLPRHLRAIATALQPGGRLFLGMKLGQGEGRDDIGRFYNYYSESELRTRLAEAGLTVSHVQTGEERGLAGSIDPYILITAHG
ncbi:class I SAM-dependent methyltransferase [Rhodophyticola sp. CCM32]|uniref:class I SAM-dependent DNA methyltransferase n=1 Tax=Rhodophyticola sp. CCM32 TaxID=2916397 RepID=UPI00107F90F8|nr:class I SAM-dependent methyltransferase [Rhodophyticola sp. CCM32]QBY01653.1 class I SAM-dependent methyltransferase [Rhodophyticola sp. CCM32]